jgi:hypothetical protein
MSNFDKDVKYKEREQSKWHAYVLTRDESTELRRIVTTEQRCALLDVAWKDFFFLARCAEAVANNHMSTQICEMTVPFRGRGVLTPRTSRA